MPIFTTARCTVGVVMVWRRRTSPQAGIRTRHVDQELYIMIQYQFLPIETPIHSNHVINTRGEVKPLSIYTDCPEAERTLLNTYSQ